MDWNVETVLRAQGCPDTQVKALVEHYTFRIIIDGQVFDARDTFEVLELSRTQPDRYKLQLYKYSSEEMKERRDSDLKS